MRQIDNMTEAQLDVLRLKGMLPDHPKASKLRWLPAARAVLARKASMVTSQQPKPIQPLHPTLKACKCGLICTKSELYKHFGDTRRTMRALGDPAREFFAGHGEVPLNVDDPRVDNNKLAHHLAMSVLQSELYKDPEVRDLVDDILAQNNPNIIPSGHRLDDNNTEIPVK